VTTDDDATRALAKAALDRLETSIMLAIADQPDGPARNLALKTLDDLRARLDSDPAWVLEAAAKAGDVPES